jgi:uncharacterized coiled-coil DUF342 family protein
MPGRVAGKSLADSVQEKLNALDEQLLTAQARVVVLEREHAAVAKRLELLRTGVAAVKADGRAAKIQAARDALVAKRQAAPAEAQDSGQF